MWVWDNSLDISQIETCEECKGSGIKCDKCQTKCDNCNGAGKIKIIYKQVMIPYYPSYPPFQPILTGTLATDVDIVKYEIICQTK